ncbi:unnamed protein product [Mytilus coruscus]|uniref:WSC domain-containing protein n=1 Tax=Mytilus coruscus TaxID=42192 RepID=A0A6J8BS49_MYTCO|nr:unnamed protein product [Mytilus coruscus]
MLKTTAEDCFRHCSDYSSATYFVMKSSRCYCLTNQPEINGDINDCRTICTNASWTPCSSGQSAMVFTFVEEKRNTTNDMKSSKRFPRFILVPTSIVVAVILCVIILILILVIISIKTLRKIRIYEEKLKKVNERLPGTEFSNYTGIEDTNEEVHDSAYKELSDNVSQLRNCHEKENGYIRRHG